MLKVSRALLGKAAVRPVLNGAPKGVAGPQPPRRGPRVTPLGIAFILGGLALGSYMLKPTTRMPRAAMDTFKPQVAIIFAKGDSGGAVKDAAASLNFQYLALDDLETFGELVEKGHTRFFIDGFTTDDQIKNVENSVVAADLVFDYDKNAEAGLRIVPVADRTPGSLEAIVKERNLA